MNVERYPEGLALTPQDFSDCGWRNALADSARDGYSGMWQAFSSAAKQAIELGRAANGKVLWLLADACSMMLSPRSVNEPFKAYMVMEGRRSAIPDDLAKEDVALFAQIVDGIDDVRLKARLADLVWLMGKPREVRFALTAIDAYRAIPLDSETWVRDGQECWERAIGLCRMVRQAADMRHLRDTYVHADEPRKISPFDGIGLLDLIVKTGIADAINSELGGMKGNKDAIAETIENNVRARILKEQISDPAYYDRMSTLLDEIIRLRKEKALAYEEYLKRIADLAKQVKAGFAEDTPPALDSPGKRALYNNLKVDAVGADGRHQADERAPYIDPKLGLVVAIDEAIKRVRPDGWRGVQAREQVIKRALYDVLQDVGEVERIFLIVRQQAEY